mmetsp:Transcript_6566/g.6798  ORF Transcript_6566/g.6798 Transcript_6566/m.6798 type:complete len:205 (-) Transcript_6566:1012-1626(-)
MSLVILSLCSHSQDEGQDSLVLNEVLCSAALWTLETRGLELQAPHHSLEQNQDLSLYSLCESLQSYQIPPLSLSISVDLLAWYSLLLLMITQTLEMLHELAIQLSYHPLLPSHLRDEDSAQAGSATSSVVPLFSQRVSEAFLVSLLLSPLFVAYSSIFDENIAIAFAPVKLPILRQDESSLFVPIESAQASHEQHVELYKQQHV